MIEIRLLEQLMAFAQYGSLSKAADYLHTSQPTLTRSMRQLEETLGVSLFERKKNLMTLNAAGLHAAQAAEHILSEARQFEADVRVYDRSIHTLSVGFCSPVPQTVMMPILNTVFDGMTLSADLSDDTRFEELLRQGVYQLAVLHRRPEGDDLYSVRCGSEQLYISLSNQDPLAGSSGLHLEDLDGRTILLHSKIGFWTSVHRPKTPHCRYLIQLDDEALQELASTSQYPVFTSDYFIHSGQLFPGRIQIPLTDPECSTDYYLACMKRDQRKFAPLFEQIHEDTIR